MNGAVNESELSSPSHEPIAAKLENASTRTLRIRRLVVLAQFSWLLVMGFYIAQAVKPRILVDVVAPDGTRMCVVQHFNGMIGEPFTTSFVFKKPDEPWGWLYYDHQDSYWRHARLELDEVKGMLRVYRADTLGGQKPTIIFQWGAETYSIRGRGGFDRTTTGAYDWLPDGWTPSKAIWAE